MFMQDFARLILDSSAIPPSRETAQAPVVTGLVAGTQVETARGWTDVADLVRGDGVQTLDGGLARVLGLDRRQAQARALLLPGGWMDACSDLCLLPRQPLLVSTLDDPEIGASPFVMVPAEALDALPFLREIRIETEVITPMFADEEVVYANSGVLLRCPGVIEGAGPMTLDSFFPTLDLGEARAFLKRREARLWS